VKYFTEDLIPRNVFPAVQLTLRRIKLKKYKRKFLVPGDSPRDCSSFGCFNGKLYSWIQGYDKMPPCIRDVARKLRRTFNLWDDLKEMDKCPHREELNKPNMYVVSEREDGKWECACPRWKFRREECHHIKKARRNPEKYEVDPEWTGKALDAIRRVTTNGNEGRA